MKKYAVIWVLAVLVCGFSAQNVLAYGPYDQLAHYSKNKDSKSEYTYKDKTAKHDNNHADKKESLKYTKSYTVSKDYPLKTGENFSKASLAFPTGSQSTSSILVEKLFPETAKIGAPYTYTIKVTNITDLPITNVRIKERMPDDFTIIKAEPMINNKTEEVAHWNFDVINPQSSVIIKYRGQSENKTALPCCTTAEFDPPALCATTILVEPSIAIDLQSPSEKLICDMIPLEFAVKNTGDSVLTNVVVNSKLPNGVITEDGKDEIKMDIGTMAVGESKLLTAKVKAKKSGSFIFRAQATSDDIDGTSPSQKTRVVKPQVSVSAQADRPTQYIGRDAQYTVVVKNTGETDLESTVVKVNLPSNTRFKSASDGARASGGVVKWDLGTLKPFDTKRLKLVLESASAGEALIQASVDAKCCSQANATASVKLQGIPALLLEVVDIQDPIEVGEIETYVITVTNQGTASATDVAIAAEFIGRDFDSDSGTTYGIVAGSKISFDPVPSLDPKETATWKVNVLGRDTGDLRFHVTMTSNELQSPVEESESTFVY